MSVGRTVRAAGVVLAGFIGAIAISASGAVVLGAGQWSRDELGFGFGGIPDRVEEVLAIVAANGRLVALCVICACTVRAAWTLESSRSVGAVRVGCDLALLVVVANNAATIGIAVAGYGTRVLMAMLPHGPLELAAFALAGSVYLQARRGPLAVFAAAAVTASALLVLVIAAALETYVEL